MRRLLARKQGLRSRHVRESALLTWPASWHGTQHKKKHFGCFEPMLPEAVASYQRHTGFHASPHFTARRYPVLKDEGKGKAERTRVRADFYSSGLTNKTKNTTATSWVQATSRTVCGSKRLHVVSHLSACGFRETAHEIWPAGCSALHSLQPVTIRLPITYLSSWTW